MKKEFKPMKCKGYFSKSRAQRQVRKELMQALGGGT
jgi:hypothetical protein